MSKGKPGWVLLCASALAALTAATGTSARSAPEYKPGELLLKLQSGSSGVEISQDVLTLRALRIPPSARGQEMEQWRVVTVPEETDLVRLKAELLSNPAVEAVEFNYRVSTDQLPNDPHFPELWGLHNIGQTGGIEDADIDAPEGWALTEDALAPIVVGLIDTGVDYRHPDLAPNIWTNPNEIPANGIDDDANGYVDDIHGWDFVSNDNDPMDDHGHGTHVAGTIAAVADNGIGVAGVSPNARIMALKILGADGYGYSSDAVEALLYAVGTGAELTNNSWGGFGYSQAFADALAVAETAGALFVASAGNDGSDNDEAPRYPVGYEWQNIVAVAATDATDTLARFSNTGLESTDLAAPGEAILSTFPGNSYARYSGTSTAAAHVTGALAVLWGSDSDGSYRLIRERLVKGVDPLPALVGKVATAGRLNLKRALGTTAVILGPDFESSNGIQTDGNGIPVVSISGPSTFELGSPADFNSATFTAEASDPDGDPLTFNWFMNGVLVGNSRTFGTTFGSPGVYRIEVIASDGADSALAVKEVTVGGELSAGDQPPAVTLTGPSTIVHGRTAFFSASVDDPDDTSFTYTWRVDAAVVKSGSGYRTSYYSTSFATPGSHTVSVEVNDGTSTVTKELTIEATNSPPSPAGLLGPSVAYRGAESTFTAASSLDPEGDPITYTWWVDGARAGVGTSLTHVFTSVGEHTIKLVVSDGFDASTTTHTVRVLNRAPHVGISASGPLPADRITPITFSALGADPDGDPLTYQWRVDGSAAGTGTTLTYRFAALGMHTVEVTASDGYDTATSTLEIEVVNLAPQVDLRGPDRADRIRPVTYDASGTVDPDNDPLSYTWRVNGEIAGAGPRLTWSFETLDTYTIELTVSDGTESVARSRRTTVLNLQPFAEAGADQTVRQISTAMLEGSGSDPEGDRLTYSWRQLSGPAVSLADASAPSTTFKTPNLRGAPTALLVFALTVTDQWGASRTDTTTVAVVRNGNLK